MLNVKKQQPSASRNTAFRYSEDALHSFKTLRLPGHRDSIALRQLYTPRAILKHNVMRSVSSAGNETLTDTSLESLSQPSEELNLLNSKKNLLIFGKGGSGKSTLLRYMGLLAWDGKVKQSRIPLLVSVATHLQDHDTLMRALQAEFSRIDSTSTNDFFTFLKKGNILLLLDDIDVLSTEQRSAVLRDVDEFSQTYPNTQVIVCCRGDLNHDCESLQSFQAVELLEFDNAQIQSFIYKWFRDKPNIAKLCWQSVRRNSRLQRMLRLPLHLVLYCEVFSANTPIHFRTELVGEYLNTILATATPYDSKNLSNLFLQLPRARHLDLLSELAFVSKRDEEFALALKDVKDQLDRFVQHLPGSGEGIGLEERQTPQREEIGVPDGGVLVQRGERVTFAFELLRDYLTARHLAFRESTETRHSLLSQHVHDRRWRDVFVFTAALLPQGDEFLQLLQTRTRELLKHDINQNLIRTIHNELQRESQNDGNYPEYEMRLLVFIYCLSYFSDLIRVITSKDDHGRNVVRALVSARELATAHAVERFEALQHPQVGQGVQFQAMSQALNSARQLVSLLGMAFEHSMASDLSHARTLARASAKALSQARQVADSEGLNLALNVSYYIVKRLLPDFRELDYNELIDYLDASILMLECLATECYITPECTKAILEGFLTLEE